MKDIIEAAFEDLGHITPDTANVEIRQAVEEAIHLLDTGKARVAAQKGIGDWKVNLRKTHTSFFQKLTPTRII